MTKEEQSYIATLYVGKEKPKTVLVSRAQFQIQTQRAGAPIFDTIIELKRGDVNEWSIIKDVAAAVDALLSGDSYEVERRTRLKQDSQLGQKV